jgi:hypothetical protein
MIDLEFISAASIRFHDGGALAPANQQPRGDAGEAARGKESVSLR